jgi:hypothetical protein
MTPQRISKLAVVGLLFYSLSAYGKTPNYDGPSLHDVLQAINNALGLVPRIERETKCVDGTNHLFTYVSVPSLGVKIQVSDQNLQTKCQCMAQGSSSSTVFAPGAKPRDDTKACESTDEQGNDNPNDDSESLVDFDELLLLLQGATGPDPFGPGPKLGIGPKLVGPRLGGSSGPIETAEASAAPAAAVGTTAIPKRVPFKFAPFPPLITGTPPNISPACNAALNPSIFEVDHINARVIRANACTGQVITIINVPPNPLQLAVTPDGSQVIVTSYNNAISFIDTNTNTLTKTIQTAANFTPSGLVIDPSGTYALVTNYEPTPLAALAEVDLASKSITRTITLSRDFPQSVFLNPDATLAWVTYPFNNAIDVIDILTGESVRSLLVNTPFSVRFNPSGTTVYTAGNGTVQVFDAKTYSLIKTIPTAGGSSDLRVDPNGGLITVNNNLGNSITVIDSVTLTPTTVPVSGMPRGSVSVPLQ